MKDIKSLEYTKWKCQYHVVLTSKYRRKAIYQEIKVDIGDMRRRLCEQKEIERIEANACPDHIHMLISIPSKYRKCVTDHEVSERKKQFDDIIRQTCKSEIEIWKKAFLGERIFYRYSREKAD